MARTSIKKRAKRILRSPRNLLITGILFVLTTTLLFANKGIWRHATLKHEIGQRTAELTKLEGEQASIERQVALLRLEDVNTIERIARERYNMKRPGETIYRAEAN